MRRRVRLSARGPAPSLVVVLVPLLAGCTFEPIGWWDLSSLRIEPEGGASVETDDVGVMQIASEGGDYASGVLRYDFIPAADGTVAVYPKEHPARVDGAWEVEGAQDLSLSFAVGETMVTFVTDHTKGDRLELETEEAVTFQVPSTWEGEGAGSGAWLTVEMHLTMER